MGTNHHLQYNLHRQEVGMDPHPQRCHSEGEVLQSDRQPMSVRSGVIIIVIIIIGIIIIIIIISISFHTSSTS
jgi:cell division protein FtsL